MTQFLSHLPLHDRETREQLRRLGPWIGLALVLLALCLAWFLLPLHEWMDALQGWFKGRGVWGVTIFALVLFVATFLPMPDWPLPVVAGYVYGVWAFPLVYVGVSVPSILAFLAARHLARDRLSAFLAKRPKYRSVDKAVGAGGWKVVALLRLSPMVPFNLQNYALGVTAISFSQYLVGTLLGITPGVAIYVYFGIFGYGLNKGPSVLDWVLLGLGVIATIVLGIVVTRKTRRVFEASWRRRR
jgi:uncharacterized membrane protein YdjX (TVP38/TMEM64 family)